MVCTSFLDFQSGFILIVHWLIPFDCAPKTYVVGLFSLYVISDFSLLCQSGYRGFIFMYRSLLQFVFIKSLLKTKAGRAFHSEVLQSITAHYCRIRHHYKSVIRTAKTLDHRNLLLSLNFIYSIDLYSLSFCQLYYTISFLIVQYFCIIFTI